MTEIEALVGLNLVMDIGSIRLKRLLEVFDAPQDIMSASRDRLIEAGGIGEAVASRIASMDKKLIEREIYLARKNDLKILIPSSPGYPQNLKFIYDPPIVLYLKGEILPQDTLAVAMVGSRHASLYGQNCAQSFAVSLAENGFSVVSGLARGIDTFSHKGALKAKGRTIAVIGSGLLNIYPQENQGLAEEIAENGAMLSEFPLESGPLRQNFPRRNRLISGLSLGVLVVEAARNSGAMITADFALEQGKDVFAVPGRIDVLSSFGVNSLIRQGAKLVMSGEDILEEYRFDDAPGCTYLQPPAQSEGPGCVSTQPAPQSEAARYISVQPPAQSDGLGCVSTQGLSCTEEQLYNIISSQAISVDEIAQKTGLAVREIFSGLLSLQLKKKVRGLAGRLFERIENGE